MIAVNAERLPMPESQAIAIFGLWPRFAENRATVRAEH